MHKQTLPKGHQEGQDGSGQLFDTVMRRHGLTRDCQLADYFGLNRSSVSRVRNGGAVSINMKLSIVAKENMTLAEVEKLIARPRFNVQAPKAGA